MQEVRRHQLASEAEHRFVQQVYRPIEFIDMYSVLTFYICTLCFVFMVFNFFYFSVTLVLRVICW